MNIDPEAHDPLVDARFLADHPAHRRRPAWAVDGPIATVGAWETLFHRRRVGGSWVDDEALYAFEHSEAFVQEVRAAGVAILVTAYDKNYCVDEEEFAMKRQLAAHCRTHGLRLAVYIRADQIYAETARDRLAAHDLLAADAAGGVPRYGAQEYRKQVCLHKTENLEAFKASIRRAIVELGVDQLHLDGLSFGGTETLGACRCEACRQDFTRFLKRRWGDDPAACRRRFGHTKLDGIEPPGLAARPAIPPGRVLDPVWQEWTRFRCTWTARLLRQISEWAYALNPDVAIMGNGALAVRENAALLFGVDSATYARHVDFVGNEDGFEAHVTDGGQVIQRVRQHHLVSASGAFLWSYMHQPHKPPRRLRVQLAQAAAFNRGHVTCLGFAPACGADFRLEGALKKQFLDWLAAHGEHFQGLEPVSDVIVWRESAAMAFAEPLTYATAMRVEQLLIEDRVPFRVVTEAWPADARVLVLPALALLPEEMCRRVIAFVRDGGSALIVGETSAHDAWGRRRHDFGLRPILPPSVRFPNLVFDQHVAGANDPVQPGRPEFGDAAGFVGGEFGRGRVVYAPQLVDPATQPSLLNPDHTYNFGLDLTNWRVPEAAEDMRRALAWLLRDDPSFAVSAPRGVLATCYRQPATGRRYVHLVNLLDAAAQEIRVTAGGPAAARPPAARLLTPDAAAAPLAWTVADGRQTLTVPILDVYSVVVVEP